MNKVICTAGLGPSAELLEIGLPRLREYADRHGYDLVFGTEAYTDGRPPSWLRIPLLAEQLDFYDVAVWIDADTLIVDLDRDIACELRDGYDFYIEEQYVPLLSTAFTSAGVVMFRAGDWAQEFLSAIWAQTDLINMDNWENSAIDRLLGYPKWRVPGSGTLVSAMVVGDTGSSEVIGGDWRDYWLSRTRLLKTSDWNSILPWPHTPEGLIGPSPVIVHYCGRPHPERVELMRSDLERLSDGSKYEFTRCAPVA